MPSSASPIPYDVVLIDCPPSLGLNSRSALVAADYVLLVTEPSVLATQGLAAATDFIDEVWHAHNRKLDVAGIVVNRVPPVSSEAEHRYDELATMVGRRAIWKPAIPQRVVVGRAIGERRPIHDLGWRSSGVSEVFDAHAAKLLRLAQMTAPARPVGVTAPPPRARCRRASPPVPCPTALARRPDPARSRVCSGVPVRRGARDHRRPRLSASTSPTTVSSIPGRSSSCSSGERRRSISRSSKRTTSCASGHGTPSRR